MAANNAIKNHIFYDSVTDTTETSTCILEVNNNASTLNIEFITSGTFSAQIYAATFDKEHFKLYPVFKLPTLQLMSGAIIDGNYFYQVDITGVDYIKVVLTAVTGTLTVRAKVVG